MKKITFKIVVFIACVWLFYGCRPPERQTAYIDQESKDYCLFKEGSYWVYEDSATLKTDSVVLEKVNYVFYEANGSRRRYNTEAYFLTFNYFIDTIVFICTEGLSSYEIRTKEQFRKNEPIMYEINNIYLQQTDFPYLSKRYNNAKPYSYNIYNVFYDSISINEIIYNVKVFQIADAEYYWSKNIGVIRMKENGRVTNLIRYNVSQ